MKQSYFLFSASFITVGLLLMGCLDDAGLSSLKLQAGKEGKTTQYNKFHKDDTAPTFCGQTDDNLTALKEKGLIYAAVANPKCGQVFSITIDGGCVDENKCTIGGDFVPIKAYDDQPSKKTVKIVVVDKCPDYKCQDGNHIDLGHFAASMDPFKTLNDLENIQSTSEKDANPFNYKQSKKPQKTPHQFNFHVKSIVKEECLKLSDGYKDGAGETGHKNC
jgi:hypothetical protein